MSILSDRQLEVLRFIRDNGGRATTAEIVTTFSSEPRKVRLFMGELRANGYVVEVDPVALHGEDEKVGEAWDITTQGRRVIVESE